MKGIYLAIPLLIAGLFVKSQTEGEQLFGETQVAIVELTFSQPGWWDSLLANYETASWMEADLVLTDNEGSYEFPAVAVRLKGNSSYSHPGNKKSFKIDFNKYVSGQNYDGLKKLNFSNNFKDPTFMREKIYFDMCRDWEIAAPRTNYADVYMNGTHWGFYTVIEQIDDQFLDWKMEDDDGNLFKAGDGFGAPGGEADLVYLGEDQSLYAGKYELKTNEDADDWSDLIEFMAFIENSTDSEFAGEIDSWLEVDEFLRSMAMDDLFSNLDAYIHSARNYYLYHNMTTGKWNWIKWDCNESFGTYAGGPGGGGLDLIELDIHYANNPRPLLERIHQIPSLRERYDEQFCMLYNGLFSSASLQVYIDQNYALISPYVLADAHKMYTYEDFEDNIYYDITVGGGPGGGTSFGLVSFVDTRGAYLEAEMDCSGSTEVSDEISPTLAVYPNPASSILFVDADQGELVEIFNMQGVRLLSGVSGPFDVSGLPSGIYLLKAKNGGRIQTVRLVIR